MPSAHRRSSRDALVAAMIGDPSAAVPAPAEVDLAGFWRRFDASAPLHLATGFRVAEIVIARLLPRLMGHPHGLAGLDADAADRVVQRAASLPGVNALAEIAKVVACFAYFSDPEVDAAVRRPAGIPGGPGER